MNLRMEKMNFMISGVNVSMKVIHNYKFKPN